MKNLLAILAMTLLAAFAQAANKPAPKSGVSFVEPKNGAVVGTEFKVVMAVSGMEIKPAGEMAAGSGHHHLLIDTPAIPAGETIPADDKHLHFGKGQTETMVKLPPGKHTLMLQFADGAHKSFGPAFSSTIEVTVK